MATRAQQVCPLVLPGVRRNLLGFGFSGRRGRGMRHESRKTINQRRRGA